MMRRLVGVVALLSTVAGPAPAQVIAPPALGAAAAAWRRDVPCTRASGSGRLQAFDFDTLSAPGCKFAQCAELPAGRRVCHCMTDSTITFTLRTRDSTLLTWSGTDIFPRTVYSLGATDVLVGDLDGDGADETIVMALGSWTRGMGVEYYDVAIVDGRRPSARPLRLTIEEYGRDGSFTRAPEGGPCRVLATEWHSADDRRRGWGYYLVGQWYSYAGGQLRPDTTRPVLARRFLHSFANERSDTSARPLVWFRNAHTEVLRAVPTLAGVRPMPDTVRGTIVAATDSLVTVRTDAGTTVVYARSPEAYADSLDDHPAFHRLGDARTGRLFPAGYRPASPGEALVGRRVAATRTLSFEYGERMLWVGAP